MTDSRPEPLPVDRLDYDLPEELIAQQPAEPRDSSRLLVVSRSDGSLQDHIFRELPTLLQPGDLIVVNDTRVLPARLLARRSSGGRVELLLLARQADGSWQSMARPARRLRPGETLTLLDHSDALSGDHVEVIGREDDSVIVRFHDEADVQRHGRVPLPPYIHESAPDPERYQTVYSREPGSAAAPTAGLHFTDAVMDACRERGVEFASVTLHVGLDTFQPIKTADARDHQIHSEWFAVSAATLNAVAAAKREGRRVVAVGTTSVRTLESVADVVLANELPADAISGPTRLYITPGYQYRVVDVMLTNFHLPRTTLLLLVSAFAGEELMRDAYAHAIRERYRFYSFGDAMLIV
ncbi:MAG TPA: tRNA preQ1(34) S-adenosylmethionine ribosyltransferase-isomerase QueA [Thermomicrobiales bacterium]|nr:tRNA preQ1(34) S-adenosylmethionine ribosyltransferase-isomerase QueA [Thermomicrobiales bacterium]